MSKIQYEIISEIKQSNKGAVYLAKVEGYEFPVIVKFLKRGNRNVFAALQAMESEYIPQIYQMEETTDGLLVVEEYIEGELLTEYLAGRNLSESQYLSVAKQLCEGLGKLHQCEPPMIHRDIKPSNIIVNSEGRVKIIDFDSARLYKAEADSDTRLLGTENYAAPEQFGYSQTDCRSDIYSMGVVFGKFPGFASKKRNRLWKKMVERCTLFAPESRYQTVEEVGKELERIDGAERSGVKYIGAAACFLLLSIAALLLITDDGEKDRVTESAKGPSSTPGITAESTPSAVPSVTPEPTPDSVPSATPEAEPASDPSPTPVMTPTTVPSPTPEVTPTPTTVPEVPSDAGEAVVWKTFADCGLPGKPENCPECRVSEDDPIQIAVLKKKIANSSAYVQYYFKDRMQKADLLTYTTFLDDARESFVGVKLYSYQSSEWIRLSSAEATEKDGICHIDGQFMDALEDGFYQLVMQMQFEGENGIREHSVYVYVAENDSFEGFDFYVENNCLEYRGEKGITLHSTLRNDCTERITAVYWEWGDVLDASLYKLLYGGRAVEFSELLLDNFMENGEVSVWLEMSDGVREQVKIRVLSTLP